MPVLLLCSGWERGGGAGQWDYYHLASILSMLAFSAEAGVMISFCMKGARVPGCHFHFFVCTRLPPPPSRDIARNGGGNRI